MSTFVKYPDIDHASIQLYPPLPQQPHPGRQILHCPILGNSILSSDGQVVYTVTEEGQHTNWLEPELPPSEHPSTPLEENSSTMAPQATITAAHPMIPVVASYTKHIVLAGLVFCCCGWLFGLAAFVLAIKAQNSALRNDQQSSRRLGLASLIVSLVGIVVGGTVVAAITVAFQDQLTVVLRPEYHHTLAQSPCPPGRPYHFAGNCYRYRRMERDAAACGGFYGSSDSFCYFDEGDNETVTTSGVTSPTCTFHIDGMCFGHRVYFGRLKLEDRLRCGGYFTVDNYCYFNCVSDVDAAISNRSCSMMINGIFSDTGRLVWPVLSNGWCCKYGCRCYHSNDVSYNII